MSTHPPDGPPPGAVPLPGGGFGIPAPPGGAYLSAGPPKTPEELQREVTRLTMQLAQANGERQMVGRSAQEAQATITRLMQERNSLVITNERTVDAMERIADALEILVQRGAT